MKVKFLTLFLAMAFSNCIGLLLPKSTGSNSYSGISLLTLFSTSSTNGNSTSAQVGTEGGVIQSSNGSYSMEIPSGALSETRQITITRDASPIGSIPEGYGKRSTVFKFEPEGLVFAKPASLTIFYDQGDMTEAGFEERTIAFYYIKDDSSLEKMKTISVDYASNKIVVEVNHFSFGGGLGIQIWLVTNGVISNPVPVLNFANNVIAELSTFAPEGYASVSAYFQANVSTLGPFLNQLVAILGYDPVSAAFPNADFDGDGIINSEDPFVPSTGPQVTLVSTGSLNVSANSGAINSTQFVWSSSKTGTFSIRKGASDCNSGTVVSSGSVSANVNQNSSTILASSDLTVGTNVYRICVSSSGVTGALSLSFNRDDSIPTVTVNPTAGNYGTVQNVALNCGDTGGAGCSKTAYTTNGSTPSFGATCALTNGSLYTTPISTPDSSITTIKYKSCDNAGNISNLYTQSYTVDSVLPSITINSVLPGTTIQGGVSPQLNWQSNKDGNFTIKIGSDCSTGTLATGTNVSGSVTTGVAVTTTINSGAQLSDGTRKINVCVTNLIGNVGTSSSTITVDSVAPTLTVTPSAGVYASPQTVTATCSDALSGCQKVAYTTNNTDPAFDSSGSITNGILYTGTLTTPNNYRFIARDLAGNVSGITIIAYSLPDSTPPTVSIQNLRNKGVVQTGFLIGSAADNTSVSIVEVSIDGGAYSSATGTTSWKFKLPIGSNTWKDNSAHTVSVRSQDTATNYSTVSTITVYKGINKDFNGDGYSDAVVGASQYNSNLGRAYIFHSAGTAGITTTAAASANTILTGELVGYSFGSAVGSGDFNGDGYADLIVGAPSNSNGKTYIFHSAGSSGVASGNSSSANSVITADGGATWIGSTSVTSGDFNGDGYADAIVGDYQSSHAYIFHSAGSSGVPSALTGAANTILSLEVGANGPHNFGISVGAGDFNRDGFADAVIGANGVNSYQGKVYIFLSAGSSGIASTGAISANTILAGEASGNGFGRTTVVGDFNGDGFLDILAASYGWNASLGRAYVFHGTGSGIASQGAASANTLIAGEAGVMGLFGYGLSAGDFNGDGYSDILLSASESDSNQGRGYIFLGSSSGVSSTVASSANAMLIGESSNNRFGFFVGVGDFNGDGFMDALLGAIQYNSFQGRSYIFQSMGSSGIASSGAGSATSIITGETTSTRFGSVSQ